jgi:hypothetical protein
MMFRSLVSLPNHQTTLFACGRERLNFPAKAEFYFWTILPVQRRRRLFAVTLADSKELVSLPAHICPLEMVIERQLPLVPQPGFSDVFSCYSALTLIMQRSPLGGGQFRVLIVDLAFAIPMFKHPTPIRSSLTFHIVIQP